MISDVFVIIPSFWAEPIIMACVFKIFKESLLPCNHCSRQASSALTTTSISSILSEEYEITVSSAYMAACAFLKAKG